MTQEISVDSLDAEDGVPAAGVVWLIRVLAGALAVYLAVSLLSWAMDRKQEAFEPMTDTEITTAVRERQLACLTKNIYYEAGGEPFEGKVAVAQVTMNRARAGGFPDDICKVIYQKNKIYEKVICQFSWVCQNANIIKPANRRELEESETVARKVLLEGFKLPSLNEALYFHATSINPGWNRKKIAQIGRHIFYQ
jgi:spore germination cell wall hydrolase CwlJ-like protein